MIEKLYALIPVTASAGQISYRLTTIVDEEEVPLAPGVNMTYFAPVALIIVSLLVIAAVGIYYAYCQKYRNRIKELESGTRAYHGWSIRKLKDTVRELENKKLEEVFN